MIQERCAAARPKFNVPAKPCDYCKSVAALLFCRAESAFMCIACDAKVHTTNALHHPPSLKHERVWMCEVCEQAPAAVTCKADAAALCVSCDRDIHSANPLASRHDRVPVVPFYDTAESVVIKSANAASTFLLPIADSDASMPQSGYLPDSWMPIAPAKLPGDAPALKSMELFFQDNSEQFLDFDSYQVSPQQQPYSDSVVPVKPPVPCPFTQDHSLFEIDFVRPNINSYNNSSSFTAPSISLSHSVSSSSMSMDVGVVPDGSSISEISYPLARNMDLGGMDREARVLRYKEKRKNRKFEKTIRYASRKAYAESRPRIKGRFAKRTDSDSDVDRIFAAGFIADARFGVVPSF